MEDTAQELMQAIVTESGLSPLEVDEKCGWPPGRCEAVLAGQKALTMQEAETLRAAVVGLSGAPFPGDESCPPSTLEERVEVLEYAISRQTRSLQRLVGTIDKLAGLLEILSKRIERVEDLALRKLEEEKAAAEEEDDENVELVN